MAVYKCWTTDFFPPYPSQIMFPTTREMTEVQMIIWTILSKVRVEARLLGCWNCNWDLLPYFMARAARHLGWVNCWFCPEAGRSSKHPGLKVNYSVQQLEIVGFLVILLREHSWASVWLGWNHMWTLSTLFIVHVHSGHFFRAINILELSFLFFMNLTFRLF